MSGELKSTIQGRTMVLSLSNPGQRNALSPAIYAAGVEALGVAEGNPEIRSVILTGEGAMFCAGGNLQRLLSNREQPAQVQADSIEGLNNWVEAIRTFPKPVIAAVEGAAAGAGFSLVLACDLIVAASNAVFVMAYSNVGLSPDGGASWTLSRSLPRQLVSELLLGGERIGAERLHQLGLVNRLAAPGNAVSDALAVAERLNAQAPNALASIKDLLNEAQGNSLNQQLGLERDNFVRNLHHPNAGIGISAFLSKQKPHYN